MLSHDLTSLRNHWRGVLNGDIPSRGLSGITDLVRSLDAAIAQADAMETAGGPVDVAGPQIDPAMHHAMADAIGRVARQLDVVVAMARAGHPPEADMMAGLAAMLHHPERRMEEPDWPEIADHVTVSGTGAEPPPDVIDLDVVPVYTLADLATAARRGERRTPTSCSDCGDSVRPDAVHCPSCRCPIPVPADYDAAAAAPAGGDAA
jgi:hypothetical protein